MKSRQSLEADEAKELILSGKVRQPIQVEGELDLSKSRDLKQLPSGLQCYDLNVSGTGLTSLPEDLKVESTLAANDCTRLKTIPPIHCGSLELRGCTALESLPDDLKVWYLELQGCNRLTGIPENAVIENGSLNISGCELIESIPEKILHLATLNVSNCPRIKALPRKLEISLWLDIGGSGIQSLPSRFDDIGLRWRGVSITHQIAFRPHELKAREVLKEKNTERRRVMIERMGVEAFIEQARPRILDTDQDPGGKRQLLLVPLDGDEDIVCLSCGCPSTGRKYLLRVPPVTKTCRQAAAWIAGYDDPKKYKPVRET